MTSYTYEQYVKAADYIKGKIKDFKPEIGMILGSGLGYFAERIENRIEIPYRDIPNFLTSTAPGHAGKFIFGTVGGKRLMCMAGRFHRYEGYEYSQLALPIRVMKLCGVEKVILTNAAGGINLDYHVGDIMIISDHIKLIGDSTLIGPNIPEFGPRFFDVQNMYDKNLRKIARECAKESELTFHEGVYIFFAGPQYETPAEIRASRMMGADASGMSTVTEALTAAHCGLPVLAFSLISNMAAGVTDQPLSEQEVLDVGEQVGPKLEEYFVKLLEKL